MSSSVARDEHEKSRRQEFHNVSDWEDYQAGKWVSKNAPKKSKYGNHNSRTALKR